MSILYILLCKTIIIVRVTGVIYHNPFWKFDCFLSVNRMFDKEKNKGVLYRYILL